MPEAPRDVAAPGEPEVLRIHRFAHLAHVEFTIGDLTVVVGSQGAGKSLALQGLKVALDGKQLLHALKAAGHPTHRPEVLIDLIFGSGMASSWRPGESSVWLGESEVGPERVAEIGGRAERLFFVPAHRSMLISDGWAAPFQKFNAETPAVARQVSQALFDRFSGKDAGSLFPGNGRLKKEIRDQIDDAVFHGGRVGIEADAQQAMRLRLVHGDTHLPFMTWTAGQRGFTPLLLGLDPLLPGGRARKTSGTECVVIEEPEMGLPPRAATAAMLLDLDLDLVLDLLWRGYRVVLSTHSPHVLTLLWMMKRSREHKARGQLVCDAFAVPFLPGDAAPRGGGPPEGLPRPPPRLQTGWQGGVGGHLQPRPRGARRAGRGLGRPHRARVPLRGRRADRGQRERAVTARRLTRIRAALTERYSLQPAVTEGMGAVRSAHKVHFAEEIRGSFADCIDIDEVLREGRERENRSDYLLGHAGSGAIVAVKPHSAKDDEVSTLIGKRKAAREQLKEHLRPGAAVARWLWVASGRVYFAHTESTRLRRAQNGIDFVGKQVQARHLPAPAVGAAAGTPAAGAGKKGKRREP
jgi:hypothetical protein